VAKIAKLIATMGLPVKTNISQKERHL